MSKSITIMSTGQFFAPFQVIDSEYGKKLYSKRMHTSEPVFGNICSNKRLNKLSLRGEEKVTAQWQLYCMVHNIEKLWRYAA